MYIRIHTCSSSGSSDRTNPVIPQHLEKSTSDGKTRRCAIISWFLPHDLGRMRVSGADPRRKGRALVTRPMIRLPECFYGESQATTA